MPSDDEHDDDNIIPIDRSLKRKRAARIWEDLQRSGIGKNGITRGHFVPLEPGEVLDVLAEPIDDSIFAYAITYYTLDGDKIDHTDFCRIRFLKNDDPPQRKLKKKNPFQKSNESKLKEKRYMQPQGVLPRVYFPPLMEWKSVLQDKESALFITEGEKKAYKACMEGYPTIALGGVWAWKSKKASLPFIDDLEQIDWDGREVNLVFDRDVVVKPEVRAALMAFTQELENRGAFVYQINLPHGEHKGLDDVLVNLGKKAFDTCVDERKPVVDRTHLLDVNDKLALYTGCKLFHLEDDQFISSSAIGILRARIGYRTVVGLSGKPQKVSILDEWLEWPGALRVRGMTYRPQAPRITEDKMINSWKKYPVEPVKGDVKPFLELVNNIFNGDRARIDFFLKWAAWPLQHPEAPKLFQAILIWSTEQGTGKSSLGYFLTDIYGKNTNSTEITHENLIGNFDYYIANKQFVLVNEASGSYRWGGSIEDKLKNLITAERIVVRKKYEPEYEVENLANFMFTSNRADAISVTGDDRRFFIHQIKSEPLGHKRLEEINDFRKSPEGIAAVYHYLLHYNLGDFSPTTPALRTDDHDEMVQQNLSEEEIFAKLLMDEPEVALRGVADGAIFDGDQLARLMSNYFRWDHVRNTRLLTSKLKRFGHLSKQVVLADSSNPRATRLVWCVKNHTKWKRASWRDWYKEYQKHALIGDRFTGDEA